MRKHLKSGLFDDRISNGLVLKGSSYSLSLGPNHPKTGPFEMHTFLFKFQMVFAMMAAISMDFRYYSEFGPLANQPLFDHSTS